MGARLVASGAARWWRGLRAAWPGVALLVPLPFVANAAWAGATRRFHWENAVVLAVVLGLFAGGRKTKRLLLGAYPLGLVGVLYSAMKLVENVGVTPERVHVCDLRRLELALFGIRSAGRRITLHDWFQAHPSALLDRLCAVPYGTFIFVCTACAAWLYVRDYRRMVRFSWCFFALNVAGFATYHLYPAAPPWYYHAYGCRVDMLAHASEGPNLSRVDAWLGVHYFAGMYGRASDVFGAMPSLHVGYALLVVLEGWAVMPRSARAATVGFFALMCFSAVYLDHHWVLDVVAGVAYCIAVVGVARLVTRRPWAEQPDPPPLAAAGALAPKTTTLAEGGAP